MVPQTEVMMSKIRPFWQQVTVIESSVDEEQRASGLIVPIQVAQDKKDSEALHRGVILHLAAFDSNDETASSILREGMVIYFHGGQTIGDVLVVNLRDIVAYEED